MAVSNFLNFSRAAEQLRITQPAVSHQINTLEDELGVKLFYRTSKRVRLTQAGHLFSQYAREILSLSRMSKARLKEGQDSSVLRFGIGWPQFSGAAPAGAGDGTAAGGVSPADAGAAPGAL